LVLEQEKKFDAANKNLH
jgi:hypothetical protein